MFIVEINSKQKFQLVVGLARHASNATNAQLRFSLNVMALVIKLLLLCLSTPLTLVCVAGESDHPAFGPPARISINLASSSITAAGSVHKSRGDSVGVCGSVCGVAAVV